MRGEREPQRRLLVTVNLEDAIPADHPIRAIKSLAEAALSRMDETFEECYAPAGRRSIPPETLIKGQLLMFLYGMRSERLFCERLRWDLLFQWFLDMDTPSEGFDATTFTKNRNRVLTKEVVKLLFLEVLAEAKERRLLSEEHFTVDGTLIEAAASMKSFRKKDGGRGPGSGNPSVNFRGEKRSNKTHRSTTDPDAKLYRKGDGRPAQLCYVANVLSENRHGICVDAEITEAHGKAEREAALEMVRRSTSPNERRVTLGGDKGYDSGEFLVALVEEDVHPHIAQRNGIKPLLDGRTTRSRGYLMSQRRRKLVEQAFGWVKSAARLGKARLRGTARVACQVLLALTTLNLIRIANLKPAA